MILIRVEYKSWAKEYMIKHFGADRVEPGLSPEQLAQMAIACLREQLGVEVSPEHTQAFIETCRRISLGSEAP